MSWLKDVEQEKRRQEQERKRLKQRYESEFRRVDPMVRRLLHDVGDLLWGRSLLLFPNYKLKSIRDGEYSHWWVGQDAEDLPSQYCSVSLKLEDKSSEKTNPFFNVTCGRVLDGTTTTPDTSESELKQALKRVVR